MTLFLVSALTLLATASCSGGGGSPTEPEFPAPDLLVLQINWEYTNGDDPVTGQSSPIAGTTIVLYNHPGGYCTGPELGALVCHPDIAECRTTPDGQVQAYHHDSLSADGPGALGPLVSSGCSLAEEYGFYTKCCLVES